MARRVVHPCETRSYLFRKCLRNQALSLVWAQRNQYAFGGTMRSRNIVLSASLALLTGLTLPIACGGDSGTYVNPDGSTGDAGSKTDSAGLIDGSGEDNDACVPATCASLQKNCDKLSDGCGATIDCGKCTVDGEVCGGAGTANVCAKSTDVTFIGAGDIADCQSKGDEATAKLVEGVLATTPTATVFTLGDNAYNLGTALEFRLCYEPTWGKFKKQTLPTAGNHDYSIPSLPFIGKAAGYYGYFGAAAGDKTKGYYSYDIGSWHIVALNSNCGDIGGCDENSEQGKWLKADLAGSTAKCTAALWHHPRFNIGKHGDNTSMQPFWKLLSEANADVTLVGHDHNYQRWAPLDVDGKVDAAKGIRQFLVGTGGRDFYAFEKDDPRVEAKEADTFGVIQFTLKANGYDWKFLAEDGKTFTDVGTGSCH